MKKKLVSLLLTAVLAASCMPRIYAQEFTIGTSAGQTAEVSYTSEENSVYSVDVTFTPNTTTTPEHNVVMELSADGTVYTKTLKAMTADVQQTERFYVRLSAKTSNVSVAGNADFKVDKLDINKASEVTFEAEESAIGGGGITDGYKQCSTGSAMVFDFEYPSGTYNIKVNYKNKFGPTLTFSVNGENEKTENLSWGNNTDLSALPTKTYDYGNVDLKQGANSFKIESDNNNVWIDSIVITDLYAGCKTIGTAGSVLRMEAEDYCSNPNQIGNLDSASGGKYVISGAISMNFIAEKAGNYYMTVRWGNQYADNKGAITVNGEELYNGATAGWSFKEYKMTAALKKGLNNITVPAVTNLRVDYIELASDMNFSAEKHSYELSDKNIDSGRRWGITGSYLGEYTGGDDWETEKVNATAKPLGDGSYSASIKYIYFPFETIYSGNYYLKVTYASKYENKAELIVDPTTLPSSDNTDYSTVSEGAETVVNGTWQPALTYAAGTFKAPYFTEKIFKIDNLAAGSHNFVFMYNPEDKTNFGTAIRKVQLVSADKIAEDMYYTEEQMIAEQITAESQIAKICDTINDANTFSAESAEETNQNTAAVVGYAYNNSAESKSFKFIGASYDSEQKLIAVSAGDDVTLANGQDANLKVKISTKGASYVKTFMWNGTSLKPLAVEKLFGK